MKFEHFINVYCRICRRSATHYLLHNSLGMVSRALCGGCGRYLDEEYLRPYVLKALEPGGIFFAWKEAK